MIGATVYQLTRNMSEEEIKKGGYMDYFVDHTADVYPTSAFGTPFSTAALAVKGDPITDLHEDMAAEQKTRVTYNNFLRFADHVF